ncbi:MAG TPA: methyltransferase domain-containing protein [Pseudolabrys sp.]|nr:methyltransferase domain-containing protein [Pseudolabrys sp.]
MRIAFRPALDRSKPVFDAARRSTQKEVLDGPLETAELRDVLHDLARFNGLMLGHRPLLRWLDAAAKELPAGRPLTVVDVGCGYGDLLRAVRGWARKRGRYVRLIGIDLSPQVIDVARRATDVADGIDYQVTDVFDFRPGFPVDFIVTSLVTHHLTDETIVRFLRWMEASARCGWVVYDLQRSVVPFYFIAIAGFLLRLHPVVVHDGRISVARSLTRTEWRELIARAGIPGESVDLRWFMFRFAIGRSK